MYLLIYFLEEGLRSKLSREDLYCQGLDLLPFSYHLNVLMAIKTRENLRSRFAMQNAANVASIRSSKIAKTMTIQILILEGGTSLTFSVEIAVSIK